MRLTNESDLYGDLTEHWDPSETQQRNVGGMNLTYVTGEQVTSRLNHVFGVDGWSFRIVEHGVNAEADEVWVLGEMVAYFERFNDGTTPLHEVTRQQFGSNKIKRRRDSGVPLDLGFDLKGASTDALKKCASLLGVGLYLSERSGRSDAGAGDSPGYSAPVQRTNGTVNHAPPAPEGGDPLWCSSCQAEIQPIQFSGGDYWSPQRMAETSRRKVGRPLCMECYKVAKNQTAKEEAQPVLMSSGGLEF